MATSSTSSLGSLGSGTFTVDANGKLKFSGIASGIDWQSIIDAQITAKRQPAVDMETKITANTAKISAYGDFKTKVQAVTTALDALRAAPGSSTNVFNSKTISGSTATDSGTGTASSFDDMLLVSLGSTAQNGTHTIKINNLATAHQVRADVVSSQTAALSTLGITPGSFTVNGKTVTISSTDTLLDLRAKINNAGAGVNATVVSSDASTNYLVLTANDTGVANKIVFGGNATLTDQLGFTTSGGTAIKNEMVEAKDADIDVDGIIGIKRSSNQIDDVIGGITFNLLKAEPGSTATLKVETDLNAVKTAVGNFVTAYNAVRDYVTAQRTPSDLNKDGKVDDNEVGPLAYDQTVRDALAQLGDLAVSSVDSNPDGFASLGQIGVVMDSTYKLQIDDSILDNKLLTNTGAVQSLFAFSSSTTDSRATVLGRGATTATGSYTINIAGTDANGNVITGNTGGDPGGASDGSLTVNGRTLTVATGDGTGLAVFFNGGPNLGPQTITISVNRGLADNFYDYFNTMTTASSGTLDTAVQQLQTVNTDYQSRIDTIDTRLEVTRQTLEAKYTAMETAMAKLQTLQQTIDGYTAQINKSSN
jgi:flagellar hook-associated protein 2